VGGDAIEKSKHVQQGICWKTMPVVWWFHQKEGSGRMMCFLYFWGEKGDQGSRVRGKPYTFLKPTCGMFVLYYTFAKQKDRADICFWLVLPS
jgi:hypothetical protein